nr:DUF1320 family protein [Phycisphaerae bacterium]
MSYATSTELEQRMGTALLVQLTDDAGTGVADPAKVAAVLEAAEAEIDSYLARRYQVPVDVAEEPRVAAILRTMTLDLAEHGLHVRRPPVPADVASRRTTTLDWLRRAA